MFDIQVLTDEVQRLTNSVASWNKWVIYGMTATAIAAIFLVIAQMMVNRESKSLADVQDRLLKLKDEKLAKELGEKDLLIARATEGVANANERLTDANRKLEEARRDTAKHELELTKQRKLLAGAAEQAAEAEAQAAEAKLNLEKFKAPRSISPEQENVLLKELLAHKGEKLRIDLYSGSEEIERFAHRLAAVLRKADLIVTEVRPVMVFGGSRSGISAVMGSEREHFANAIGLALLTAKLISGPLPATKSQDGKELVLVIGPK